MNTVLSTILALMIRAANNPSVQRTAYKAARIATKMAIKGVAEYASKQASFRHKRNWSN